MFGRMHFGEVFVLTFQEYVFIFQCDIFSRAFLPFFSSLFYFFLSLSLEAYFVIFRAVDHQWDGGYFATAGAQVDIWNQNRYIVLNFFIIFLIQGAIFQLYDDFFF